MLRLRRCPCCNGRPKIGFTDDLKIYIFCKCGTSSGDFDTVTIASRKWNRRHSDTLLTWLQTTLSKRKNHPKYSIPKKIETSILQTVISKAETVLNQSIEKRMEYDPLREDI